MTKDTEALRDALNAIREQCQSTIDLYERNGPSYTSSVTGVEYEHTSFVQAKMHELAEIANAALATPASDVAPVGGEKHRIMVWDVRGVEDCGHRGMKGYEVLLPDGTWTDVAAHDPEGAIATANLDWRAAHPPAQSVDPVAGEALREAAVDFMAIFDPAAYFEKDHSDKRYADVARAFVAALKGPAA